MNYIDLNCDMGEVPEASADGTQEALMPYLTSVNIACGGHAGDEHTMRATIEQALRWSVAVGAHPGYPDRVNFGRLTMGLPPDDVAQSVFDQVRAFARVAKQCGASVTHVKAHGALYNQAARDPVLAGAIARGVARWSTNVILVGLAGSPCLDVFRGAGFSIAAEAFADRRYEPDGSLRPRTLGDALIPDPREAARQALCIVKQGTVIASDGVEIPVHAQTICIHGDTPGAMRIAAAVSGRLRESGVRLLPLSSCEAYNQNGSEHT